MPRSLTHNLTHRPIISRSCPHERRNMRSVWPNWDWLETGKAFSSGADAVVIPNSEELNFSGEITLSAWVKIEETGGYRGILEHGYYGGREVFLRVASGKYQVGIYQSKTNSMAEAAVDPADIGTWVHLVGTYDGSSWNLYKNGELIASSPSTVGVLPVNCDWLIGGSQATNRCFKGEIRDAGIWNVAMTPDEVSAYYTQVTSSATYNALGNVLTQTDVMGNTTSYTYDTMGRVLTVTDALNHVTSYTYDALGRLLTTTDDVLWSLTDHLGTVRDVLGTASAHLIYDAFGNLTSGTNPLLFGYTSKAFDTDTHLQNNINRWYDAAIGRWLSTDPIGFEGSDMNLYRYINNKIVIHLDLLGLESNDCKCPPTRQECEAVLEQLHHTLNQMMIYVSSDGDHSLKDALSTVKVWATAAGYRSEELKKQPCFFQQAVEEIESSWVLSATSMLMWTEIIVDDTFFSNPSLNKGWGDKWMWMEIWRTNMLIKRVEVLCKNAL